VGLLRPFPNQQWLMEYGPGFIDGVGGVLACNFV